MTAVEVSCGAGALNHGCGDGPAEFRRHGDPKLRSKGMVLSWQRLPRELGTANADPIDVVHRTSLWTAGMTRRLTACGESFVVIGGDHSCAIGTWSGAADALRRSGPLGLVWIDAHMDLHVPATTHSGAINGMPLAALLGYGAPALTSVARTGAAIHPHHVCLVGVRSFEAEELALAERLNIRLIRMEEVSRRGVEGVLAEAQAIAADGTAGYGVSLDLDAFDPLDAPGVGTPVPGGIRAATFLDTWSELTRDPKCVGIEIAEYNPGRDESERTARLISKLIASGLKESVS
jgi:arginase